MSFWEREIRFGPPPEPIEKPSLDLRPLLADGSEGVTRLLAHLSDSSIEVRVAAAQALSESDDERALPALLSAFRRTFPAGSSRLYIVLGFAGVLGSLLQLAASYWRGEPWGELLLFPAAGLILTSVLLRTQRYLPEFRLELIDAFIRISERQPSPEMSVVVDDLRLISRDRGNLAKPQRERVQEAHQRLKELTSGIRALPVISHGPPAEGDSLPLPALTPETAPSALPRPATEPQRIRSG